MKKVLLQVWEEFNRKEGIRQDGCSIHIDNECRESYINKIYKNRNAGKVPNSYQKVLGEPSLVEISDILYSKVELYKNIRLRRYEMNNLLNMEEIIVLDENIPI